MNQYMIDLQFTHPELKNDEEVTEWLDLDELLGKDQSWADRISVVPWKSIEVHTSLSLGELRAELAQVLNRHAKKQDWWDDYDGDVMEYLHVIVSDIWTASAADQPPIIFAPCRYQIIFDVDEALQEQLNPADAVLYRDSEYREYRGAEHNEVVHSFVNDGFEWATDVFSVIWGVFRFTSSLSMNELEEKFNLVLPPYIKVSEFLRAVPRNYVSAE